jgi:NAD(P)H dehydrogenase (quinone)
MKYFVIVCHPEPKSFCKAMFHVAVDAIRDAGHEVRSTDIYDDHFDPLTSRKNFKSVKNADFFKPQAEENFASECDGFSDEVLQEILKIEWCDVLIIQFPMYWFSVPAGIKGWFDRVLAMGRCYGGGRIYDTGAFKGKKAVLSFTTGGPQAAYVKDGFNGDINAILRPIHRGVFEFCGFSVLQPMIVYAAAHGTDHDREEILQQWKKRAPHLHSEEPIVVGQY